MASEQGVVIKTGLKGKKKIALVKTIQPGGCEACSVRAQCNPDAKGKEREVEAVNLVDAREGDLIQISMDTQALLQATFLLYIFPIVCMLMGAFIGHIIGTRMGAAPSILSLTAGLICFVAAMYIVRGRAGHMALKLKYQPKITRIFRRGKSAARHNGCGLQAIDSI